MPTIKKDMEELRKQLQKGSIQKAYRTLLAYIMALRTHFKNNLAGATVSGLYQGYMDMTFFALFPSSLKPHNLKIAIVFNYHAFRFEAWLAGGNRKVQRQYWELFKDNQWPEYRVVTPAKGIDSILECDLSTDFDLNDRDALTASVEKGTIAFIDDIERFLAEHPSLDRAGSRD